jgi:hypothetical protein
MTEQEQWRAVVDPEVVVEVDAAEASVARASESRFSLKRLAEWLGTHHGK